MPTFLTTLLGILFIGMYVPLAMAQPRSLIELSFVMHDDVITCKHFPRYWTPVRGFHRSPVNFPHKGQWRGTLMFSFICSWISGWVNNGEAGDLGRHHAHNDVIVMDISASISTQSTCFSVGSTYFKVFISFYIYGRYSPVATEICNVTF